ncbi:MAG: hypothetical protein NDF53_00135 [archaeon GB-1867-097]|nr:hypothetical protein [Candidatus Verstraetearchaeota archaeon]MCS7374045.1 hypothetical protein [Candidatus Culexmicrobium thermophilum]MCS7384141.1 hypothetical protein [Candidatus Culexmicrobium thermophilum]
MIKIKIGEDRFSSPQIALLLKLREGENETRKLLRTMWRFGFRSRSSFYAALSELEEKGYIERDEYGRVKLTGKGEELVEKIPEAISSKIQPLINYVSFIMEKAGIISRRIEYRSIADEIEDAEELERYHRYLLEELKKVKERLKKWRRIKVE